MTSFSFSKKEKLKGKKQIEQLFQEGNAITVYPLKLIYAATEFKDGSVLKTAVSVSKRLHKKATKRNRIKRLLREAYRLHKPKDFNKNETAYALMILYLSKEEPTFDLVRKKMPLLISKFENATARKS
jgi:ribonuclease P protein component